jgi:hypothetical protein
MGIGGAMTDDEIVMVLRCAADLTNVERYAELSTMAAAAAFGYLATDAIAVRAFNRRVSDVGMFDVYANARGYKAKRDALLEAAARIEERSK